MESKGLIESIREFLLGCPFLKDGVLNVDYLGIAPTEYSVDSIPAKSILKEYINGSSVRQFVFAFGSVEPYGSDVDGNIANSGFYEDFATWMEERNRNKEFPILYGGRNVIEIEAQGAGYVIETSENAARYQIQCRIIYFQEGR
ncbi:hypothetical protein [Anaerotignum sp. MB30-C6]|uniref:hypothetical protein n=1 Tax=Anaerotignum sp. MB30-C6 TaxID=3070814 RepID=UPI0027DDC5D2|nr:hypothetical protein [Anaerotignum sp. MB30-C6]WMI81844.1 hypothetical protein RBQ60_03705 [Anaerotignum sp. MB30-C6]